jgi:dephospho-CoA kinase
MKIIGLTGSIAMGKSYIASIFGTFGIRVFDADKAIAVILARHSEILRPNFNEAYDAAGKLDKNILANIIYHDAKRRKTLGQILRPLLLKHLANFLKDARRTGAKMVVLEIALLFERNYSFDYVIVASASKFMQTKRALRRENMTLNKLQLINASQMCDAKKRCKTKWIIYTSADKATVVRQVLEFMRGVGLRNC